MLTEEKQTSICFLLEFQGKTAYMTCTETETIVNL